MMKQEHRAIKEHCKGYTSSKLQSQSWIPGFTRDSLIASQIIIQKC